MELNGYLSIVRRWWWTLLVATWVAGLAGLIAASALPKIYEAEARVLVGPINTDLNTQRAAGQLAQTYAELLTSQPLLEAVALELGLDEDGRGLQGAVSASPNDVTRLVAIRVQLGDPELAARIANNLATELSELASGSASLARPEGEVQVVDYADPPRNPVAPQVSLIAILAAAAGLLGAIVVVLLVEYFSDPVRTIDELEVLIGASVLGTIRVPPEEPNPTASIVALSAPGSPAAAAYRVLATKIEADSDARTRSILVVASGTGDRSGLVATNIAAALAAGGRRPALVDGNLEDPQVTRSLGLAGEPGIGELIAGESFRPTVVEAAGRAVVVVPTGRESRALVSLEQIRLLVGRLSKSADVVLAYAGPVSQSSTTLLWAQAVESTILVVRPDRTRRDDVRAAADSLRFVGARLAGAVWLERGLAGLRRGRAIVGRRPTIRVSPETTEAAIRPKARVRAHDEPAS